MSSDPLAVDLFVEELARKSSSMLSPAERTRHVHRLLAVRTGAAV